MLIRSIGITCPPQADAKVTPGVKRKLKTVKNLALKFCKHGHGLVTGFGPLKRASVHAPQNHVLKDIKKSLRGLAASERIPVLQNEILGEFAPETRTAGNGHLLLPVFVPATF